MKEDQSKDNEWWFLGAVGILSVAVLCCAGPVFLVALGGIGIAAIFAGAMGSWWIFGIFAAAAIALMAFILRKSLRNKKRR